MLKARIPLVGRVASIVLVLVVTGCFWTKSDNQPTPVIPNASLITGYVQAYSIVNSKAKQVEPEMALYILTIVVESSESVGTLANFVKAGDVIEVFSTQELSPCLFGKRVKAEVNMRGGEFAGTKFWLAEPASMTPLEEVGPAGLQACR